MDLLYIILSVFFYSNNYNMLKNISLLTLIFFLITGLSAQDFGGSKVGLANFARRMFNAQAFDGIKILQTEEGIPYMISVVSIKKDPSRSESVQSRIASVKSKAFASQYVNGSYISSEVIIVSKEEKSKDIVITKTELQETLKETSMGFAEGMELLINFESNDGKQVVYIYYKEIKK